MVHNKNKHSKLPAKPSDSWISSDLWLKIAFSLAPLLIFKWNKFNKKWRTVLKERPLITSLGWNSKITENSIQAGYPISNTSSGPLALSPQLTTRPSSIQKWVFFFFVVVVFITVWENLYKFSWEARGPAFSPVISWGSTYSITSNFTASGVSFRHSQAAY